MQQSSETREYLLDNQFFANIDNEDVQKGKVKVTLTITKNAGGFQMNFTLNGTIVIPCDRCLDDMDYPVDSTARLMVKFGKDYSEESDEVVIIPEKEGVINLAWFLYEFVVLSISIKHVHAPGKCNKQMQAKLKKHSAKSTEEDDDSYAMENDEAIIVHDDDNTTPIDPRWDALKDLKEN
ncbi:hypothetical protein FACS189413_16760 [Bacteroidia bacterium]|nr:hypothetical protein FACS189413_16760 [Bacteroidia bacterium]